MQSMPKALPKHFGGDDDDVQDPSTYITPGRLIDDSLLFAGEWEPLLKGMTKEERISIKKDTLPEYGDWEHVLKQQGRATDANFRDMVSDAHVKTLLGKIKEMDSKILGLDLFEEGGYEDKIRREECPAPTYVNWNKFAGNHEPFGMRKRSDYFEFLEYGNRILRDIEELLAGGTRSYYFATINAIPHGIDSDPRMQINRVRVTDVKLDPEVERLRGEEKRMAAITASKQSLDEIQPILYQSGVLIEHLLTYTASALEEMFPAADFSPSARPPWEKGAVKDFLKYYDIRAAQTLLMSWEKDSSNAYVPRMTGMNIDIKTYFKTNPGFVWLLVRAIGYQQHQWMVLAASMYRSVKAHKLRVIEQWTTDNIQNIPVSDKPHDLNGPLEYATWRRRHEKKLLEGDLIPEKQLRNLIATVEPLFVVSSFMHRTSQRNRDRSPMYRFNAVLGEWLFKTYKSEYNELRGIYTKMTGREWKDVEAEYKGKIWAEGAEARQARAREEDEKDALQNRQQLRKKKRPLKVGRSTEEEYTRLLDDRELQKMLGEDIKKAELQELVKFPEQASVSEEEEDVDQELLQLTTRRKREYKDRRPTQILSRIQSPRLSQNVEKFVSQQHIATDMTLGRLNSKPGMRLASETYSPLERGKPSRSPSRPPGSPFSRTLSPGEGNANTDSKRANSFFGAGISMPMSPKLELNINQFGPGTPEPSRYQKGNSAMWQSRGLQRRPQITEADDGELKDVVGSLPGHELPPSDKIAPSRQISSTSKTATAGAGVNPMAQGIFVSPRSYFSRQTTSKPGTHGEISSDRMNDEYYDSVPAKSGNGGLVSGDNTQVKWGLSMSNKPGSGMMKPSPRSNDLMISKFESFQGNSERQNQERNSQPNFVPNSAFASHRDSGYSLLNK